MSWMMRDFLLRQEVAVIELYFLPLLSIRMSLHS